MKHKMMFALLMILFTIPIIYLSCLSDDIEPTYALIHEDGETLLEASCDSLGSVITTPSYTFTNVIRGYIIKTQPNTSVDTFFEFGVWKYSPFIALALAAGLDTNLVCEGTIEMDSLLSISGMISLGDSVIGNGAWWIAVDEADHCCWALVSLNATN